MVGSQVVRRAGGAARSEAGPDTDPAKAAKPPAGVKAVTGDLSKVETVKRVFKGVDGVFLVNNGQPDRGLRRTPGGVRAREEKVKRVVYLSVHHADGAPWLPHFGGKLGVEQAVLKSGVPSTVLRPNNFYQNDYWFKDVLLQHGVYPQPIGDVGLHRVDVRDIAEAAAVALTTSGHEGQTYDLVGPEAHTGESTAAWRERSAGRSPMAATISRRGEKQSLQFMPDWLVYDFKHMYAFFQAKGLKASPEAIERQTRLLGHAPRSFGAFVSETAAGWR